MLKKVGRIYGLQKHPGANCIIFYLKCTWSAIIEEHFAANCASISARRAELWQICQGDLNRPFSEILPRRDQGKMLKKVGRIYGLQKHPSANHIVFYLICTWSAIIEEHFAANCASISARRAELWQICQGDLNRPFSEILPRGDQSKMLQKVCRIYRLQKHPGANSIILYLICTWSAIIEEHFTYIHTYILYCYLPNGAFQEQLFCCKLRLHKCP